MGPRAQNLPLSLVVNIDVPDEVILDRIGDRFVHLPSGRVYNLKYSKPKVDGLDDVTGEALTKRPDDNAVSSSYLSLFISRFLTLEIAYRTYSLTG
jgi:adenylate kinase family enzyme